MKVVTRTGEYTIYKKRSQRYAVRNKERQWVRGDDKVAILLSHNLVQAPVPSGPDHPEDPETGEELATAEGTGEQAASEGQGEGSEESST